MNTPEYSVVVPLYNEAEGLIETVTNFLGSAAAVKEYTLQELILVENGSTDATRQLCASLAVQDSRIVAAHIARGSYGEAIRHGMRLAQMPWIMVLECDFLLVDFIQRAMKELVERGASVVVGSKLHPQSADGRPLKRRLLTRLFNLIINWRIGYPGSDTHGLKGFQTALAKELCDLCSTTDELLQSELVIVAWATGHNVHEVPIRITEQRGTRVSIRRRLPMVRQLVRALRASRARFREIRPGTVVRV